MSDSQNWQRGHHAAARPATGFRGAQGDHDQAARRRLVTRIYAAASPLELTRRAEPAEL